MTKKSFVSIYFSSQKIQILSLSSGKKRVKNVASIDVPAGLIKNYRVYDSNGLSTLLKNSWKKAGVKEKSVGIVIPEFSTFTKNLQIPKLDTKDLDEAVRWQAQEFLPWSPRETILDWKIVKEDKKSVDVLLVAIRKDILAGYVDTVAAAGLYPLVVEIPSLSLARIADPQANGKLILYSNLGEGILVVADGEKILGSSVVPLGNQEELVKTASQIVKHYSQVNIEKVEIGGREVGAGLPKKLQEIVGKKVEWIKHSITGLSNEDTHLYLIPLSLQLKDPSEPVDEHTINLLPPAWVKKYKSNKHKVQIWSATLLITFIVWFSFLAVLGVYLFMQQQITTLKEKGTTGQKVTPQQVEVIAQIKEINTVSDAVLKITSVSYSPQKILNSVYKATLPGITITNYKVDLEVGKVQLRGVSVDRQALLDFKQLLEEQADFSLVDIPISSFEGESDLEFTLEFSYLPAISKKVIKLN